MKKYVLLSIAILFLLTGCARSHYYKVDEDHVHIYLTRPEARTVYFVSSLDMFEPIRAKKNCDETWEVTVPKDIVFSYFYIVDEVVYIPLCAFKESDDFGSQNCIYVPGM